MDEMGFFVSQNLHHYSIRNIFYAPMAFFDTTVRWSSSGSKNRTDASLSPWEEYSVCSGRISRVRQYLRRIKNAHLNLYCRH